MRVPGRWVPVLVSALLTVQCATAGQGVLQQAPASERATAIRAAAAKIPPGSRVSVALADGTRLKAILLAVEGDDTLIVQRRTRLPEPPLRVHAMDVTSLELDVPHTTVGKMIAIGAGIGTAVTLAFLAILAAAIDD